MRSDEIRARGLRDLSPEERGRLVERLSGPMAELLADVQLVSEMLTGPDPEAALLVLADALDDLDAALLDSPSETLAA